MLSTTFVTMTQRTDMYNTISRLSASGGSPTVAAGLAGSQGPSSPTLPPGKQKRWSYTESGVCLYHQQNSLFQCLSINLQKKTRLNCKLCFPGNSALPPQPAVWLNLHSFGTSWLFLVVIQQFGSSSGASTVWTQLVKNTMCLTASWLVTSLFSDQWTALPKSSEELLFHDFFQQYTCCSVVKISDPWIDSPFFFVIIGCTM